MYYASFMLFVLSLGSSKISVMLFQARLTASLKQRRLFRNFAFLVGTWTLGSLLALALQCELTEPWRLVGHHCHNMVGLGVCAAEAATGQDRTGQAMADRS
jgi:hypothetical protein